MYRAARLTSASTIWCVTPRLQAAWAVQLRDGGLCHHGERGEHDGSSYDREDSRTACELPRRNPGPLDYIAPRRSDSRFPPHVAAAYALSTWGPAGRDARQPEPPVAGRRPLAATAAGGEGIELLGGAFKRQYHDDRYLSGDSRSRLALASLRSIRARMPCLPSRWRRFPPLSSTIGLSFANS